jgi:hypothetical protein
MEVIDYIGTSIDIFLNMDDEVPMIVKFKSTIKSPSSTGISCFGESER